MWRCDVATEMHQTKGTKLFVIKTKLCAGFYPFKHCFRKHGQKKHACKAEDLGARVALTLLGVHGPGS